MAGSHRQVFPFSPLEDPILSARLETVKLLADRLSEHVVVIDRTLNVVYANESVWSGTSRPAPMAGGYICYEVFMKWSNQRADALTLIPDRFSMA